MDGKDKLTKEELVKAASGRIESFAQDSIIIWEGMINPYMYKIIKGSAELYVGHGTPNETLVGVLGPQACFGEFGLLLKKPSIYTVVAFSELYLLRVGEADLESFVRENNKNVIDIMHNMANTMYAMSTQINLLVEELGSKEDSPTRIDPKEYLKNYFSEDDKNKMRFDRRR